jgi:hypothetical protein
MRSSARACSRIVLSATLAGIVAPVAMGDIASLDITLADGTRATTVPEGGTFNVLVAVEAPHETVFNAALFRLIFTVEGCQVLDYEWHAPFVTGGVTDFSLDGLPLPITVDDSTLDGPGYPAFTADAEFGNFDFFLASTGGPLMSLTLRAPVDAEPGSHFFVVAYPDLLTDGFTPVDIESGSLITVSIANSGVVGDLSGDGVVNSVDLAILLGNWGVSGPGDLDESGVIDSADLALLIGAWGI